MVFGDVSVERVFTGYPLFIGFRQLAQNPIVPSSVHYIPPLVVRYRPFGGGQSAFEITAVLVGGFRAGKMDGTVPNGGLTCRGVIEGVFVHRRLVELGGGKSFASPILVEEGRRRRGEAAGRGLPCWY